MRRKIRPDSGSIRNRTPISSSVRGQDARQENGANSLRVCCNSYGVPLPTAPRPAWKNFCHPPLWSEDTNSSLSCRFIPVRVPARFEIIAVKIADGFSAVAEHDHHLVLTPHYYNRLVLFRLCHH